VARDLNDIVCSWANGHEQCNDGNESNTSRAAFCAADAMSWLSMALIPVAQRNVYLNAWWD
jgi:hypothetical protein